MRRANKILMSAVAILLCLVLISTSVVSGIFARFVITQKITGAFVFSNFGVDVTITPNTDKYPELGNPTPTTTSVSSTVAFNQLSLRPGSDYSEAIKIKFSGTPNVKVKVSVIFHVNYTSTGTYSGNVPADIGLVNTATGFLPIGFTLGAKDALGATIISTDKDANNKNYVCNPWKAHTSGNPSNTVETAISNGVAAQIAGLTSEQVTVAVNSQGEGSYKDYSIVAVFDPNPPALSEEDDPDGSKHAALKKDIADNGIHFHSTASATSSQVIKELVFGFTWPKTYTDSTGYDYDSIGTYLAANSDGKPIKIWYTVKLEQVR